MAAEFDRLPAPVRAMHDFAGERRAMGEVTIATGSNPLGRLIDRLLGFPRRGERLPLRLRASAGDGVEVWTREFDGHRMRSEHSARGGLLVERFGPLRFGFALRREADGLSMYLRRWWCGPMPMPRALAPRCVAREFADGDRFHFDVPIAMPLIGPIIHYRGWLRVD
jgi:hypothetical protein